MTPRIATIALLFASAAHAEICGTPAPEGAVFAVFQGGTISLSGSTVSDPGGKCNLSFLGSSTLHVPPGGLVQQGSCGVTGDSVAPTTMTLPAFRKSATQHAVFLQNADQFAIRNNAGQTSYYNRGSADTVVSVDGRTYTIPKKGTRTVTLPSGDYAEIQSWNGNEVRLSAGSVIKKLSLMSCNGYGLAMESGDYWIEDIGWQAGCSLEPISSGAVRLYVNGPNLTLFGGPTCINWTDSRCPTDSTVEPATLPLQHPERLLIVLYNGDVTTQGQTKTAAAIYAATGTITLANGAPYAFAGEAVAKKVTTQNNSQTYFQYLDTKFFKDLYPAGSPATLSGEVSYSAPVAAPNAQEGSLSYVTYNTVGTARGTLKAFELRSNGLTATTARWSAAALMDEAVRRSRIYTTDAANNVVLLDAVDSAAFGANAANAAATRNALFASPMGQPLRFAPILFGDVVVVGASDGVVYAFDKTSGQLAWGFVPRTVLPLLNSTSLASQQPVLQAVRLGDGLVLSILGATQHQFLSFNATGKPAVVTWSDVRVGVAPAYGAMAVSTSKVGYAIGATSIQATVAGPSATLALPAVAQSNPVFLAGTLFEGLSSGATVAITTVSSPVGVLRAGESDGVQWTNAIRRKDGTFVTSASKKRVTVFRDDGNGFRPVWTLGTDGMQDQRSGSDARVPGVPPLPADVVFTAPPVIAGDVVLLPGTFKEAGKCLSTAAYFGPYYLAEPALAQGAATYGAGSVALTDSLIRVGVGEALAPTLLFLGNHLVIEAHSNQNTPDAAGSAPQGLDDPIKLAKPPRLGSSTWLEITDGVAN